MYSIYVYTLDLFGFDGDICLGRLTDEKAVSCFEQNYVSLATVLPFLIKAFHQMIKGSYKRNVSTYMLTFSPCILPPVFFSIDVDSSAAFLGQWDVIRQHSVFTSVYDLYHAMRS